jgi:hypothetical protein
MVGMPNSDALCGRQTILRGSIKSAHRAGPEAGAPGKDAEFSSSVKADNGRVRSIDTKRRSDRGICPAFRFLAFDVWRWAFNVRCSVSPATPLGLEKIMDDITQGSPADGTTLGWMMQSRWDKQILRRRVEFVVRRSCKSCSSCPPFCVLCVFFAAKTVEKILFRQVLLALARSSRREEAPTNPPAIVKSLMTSAATAGQGRISPLARDYYAVTCPTYPDTGISNKAANVEALMSLAFIQVRLADVKPSCEAQ